MQAESVPTTPVRGEGTSTSEEPATILLVDDNPAKLFSLESVLSDLHIKIVTAGSARAALRHLLNQEFAVILLDVNMPEMDGFELAQLIRQRPRLETTPIIFVTAISTSEAERVKGYGLGAVDYLFMPIVPEVLRAKVTALVDLYKKTRQVQKQAQELAKLNEALERQLKHIEQLNDQLALSNRELEAFTYSVSHDLRSPLKTAQGFCSLLRSDLQAMPEQAQEHLSYIESSLERADRLIAGLLSLSRVTRTPLRTQDVDLAELARSILPELEMNHPGGAQIVIPESLPTRGDPELLIVALQNLLGNALKFSSRTQGAKIELGALPGEEGRPVYYVKDNGAGFSPEQAHKLFTPFQRLHSSDEFPGTGVGLVTVQRVIRRHGGKIWADSRPNQGATFFFTLGLE